MELIWKWLTVALWCMFKFLVGIMLALGFQFNLVEALLTAVGGGMVGVIVYLYVWDAIVWMWQKFFPPKIHTGIKINKKLRMIVNLINKYEIYGIAFLTPVLLSVPVGVIIAAMVEKNKWRIKWMMLVSLLFWTLLIYALYHVFGIDIHGWFSDAQATS